MAVLTPLKPFFDGLSAAASPAREELSTARARAAMHSMIEANFNVHFRKRARLPAERDHRIPVAGGEITLRVYSAAQGHANRPAHLFIHGGGFWLGTLEHSDFACRGVALDAGCVVISVDYRLAPEHKFPAAAEDSYAALLWVADHAKELGIDATRMSVGGASAGGNLAAAVALMARDRRGPSLVLQILEIPVTDLTNIEPLRVPAEGLVIPSGKDQYRAHYLADLHDATNAYASPLLAADLKGLPPALVMCAEYDPLRPEGEAYARRLSEAGVRVEYRCWEGQFHGSQNMAALIPQEAAAYHDQLVHALRRAYG